MNIQNKTPKVIGAITARMASTRLPGKVLQKLGPKSTFAHHVERMKCVEDLDGVFLATSTDPKNRPLIELSSQLGCGHYAGAEQDIVDRHIKLCEQENASAVIRITCDCPIFDIESASRFVELFKKQYHDYIYVSNMTMIQGTLAELISYKALLEVHKHYRGAAITQHIKENLGDFKTKDFLVEPDLCRPEYRLTVDEAADIEMIGKIYQALYQGNPLDLHEVYTWLDDNPQVAKLNMHVGIKGCNKHSANLLGKFLYTIVHSGRNYVILDEHKRKVEPEDFMVKYIKMFPQIKRFTEKNNA